MENYNYRIRNLYVTSPKACVCSACLKIVDAMEGSYSTCCSVGIIVCVADLYKASKGSMPTLSSVGNIHQIKLYNASARKVLLRERIYRCWKNGLSVVDTKNKISDYPLTTYGVFTKFIRFEIWHKGRHKCIREKKRLRKF